MSDLPDPTCAFWTLSGLGVLAFGILAGFTLLVKVLKYIRPPDRW